MSRGKHFTEEEKELLRGPGRYAGEKELRQLFPNRNPDSVENLRKKLGKAEGWDYGPDKKPLKGAASLTDRIRALVAKEAMSLEQLCDKVDRSPSSVRQAIAALQADGFRIELTPDEVRIPDPVFTGYTEIPLEHFTDGEWFRFGIVSDTHLGNKHARLDVLNHAYDAFEADGIRAVFHGGNWIDGVARFNRNELVTGPTFHAQVMFFLEHYPQRPSIITHVLSGDDHEGWHQQEGYDVGFYLQAAAEKAGRSDIHQIGYGEADIPFAVPGGVPAMVRLSHPKGGSSYALSYKPQKTVESYEGGEKPAVLVIGHYHKAGYFYWRNVHTLLAGCLERQTYFMRGKQLAAHVGYWTVSMQVHKDGSVPRFLPEFHAFFNESYYQNRYGLTDEVEVLRSALSD